MDVYAESAKHRTLARLRELHDDVTNITFGPVAESFSADLEARMLGVDE
jgi:hypothetical protein